MVAYSYQRQFIEPMERGDKRQTMRNDRPRHARPGEEIQHYYAMRTKQCRLIGRSTCTAVTKVSINFVRQTVRIKGRGVIHGKRALDTFAQHDGFADWGALVAFWYDKHPEAATAWQGILIEWRAFVPAPASHEASVA